MRLPKFKKSKASFTVTKIFMWREMDWPEEQIAGRLNYDSVEEMRRDLERWGIPDWLVGGDPKRVPANTEEQKKSQPPVARGSGPITELPPANRAAPLFREKLETLAQAIEDLKYRKEKLEGKRFVHSGLHRGRTLSSPQSPPDDLEESEPDEQRQHIREVFDLDPEDEDFVFVGGFEGAEFGLGGATCAPQPPLPALIGAYLLAGGEVKPLVKALHPDPASVDWSKIRDLIEGRKNAKDQDGLKKRAAQLAILVRGPARGPGAPKAASPADEVNLACRITEMRDAQMSLEEIYEEILRIRPGPWRREEEISWKEFKRLADLGLRWPFA